MASFEFLITKDENAYKDLKPRNILISGWGNTSKKFFEVKNYDSDSLPEGIRIENVVENLGTNFRGELSHRRIIARFSNRKNYKLLVFCLQGLGGRRRIENQFGAFMTDSDDPIGLIREVKPSVIKEIRKKLGKKNYLEDPQNPFTSTLLGDYEIGLEKNHSFSGESTIHLVPKNSSNCLLAFEAMRYSIREGASSQMIMTGNDALSDRNLRNSIKKSVEDIIYLEEGRYLI